MSDIVIKGAREHNLKNIDLTIPRNKIVCFVGVSGSGKSTIAFDIIAREGQRQYFESLSSYARRYLQKSNRPLVEETKGISPTVVISQDRIHANPRSTVGTVTETYTYLRLLYSRVGLPSYDSSYFSFNHPLGACPRCKGLGQAMDINISSLIDDTKSLNEGAILYSNWRVNSMMWKIIKVTRYFDMEKKLKDFTPNEIKKLLYAEKEVAPHSEGALQPTFKGIVTHLKSRGSSTHRFVNDEELKYFTFIDCPECQGWRVKRKSLEVELNGRNIGEVGNMSIVDALEFVKGVTHRNANVIKPRLIEQLQFLIDSGVGYLSLNRSTSTLSGGEAQRVKVARQLGCDLIETIYVLDEPTAGLHPKDIDMIVQNLQRLKVGGNTILVVEHDPQVIKASDHIVEVGPGGGKAGGRIVCNCSLDAFMNNKSSITAPYLLRKNDIPTGKVSRISSGFLHISNATKHNLKNVSVDIPTGMFVCLTGVSGAGKSSLVETIMEQSQSNIVLIDQKSIGSNKRGCIATYVGVFDEIRKVFARETGASVSSFSFNSIKGACPSCKGLGNIAMDMNFLGNIEMRCERCNGRRYREEVMKLSYREKNIADLLEMTASEAQGYFSSPVIFKGLDMLLQVGLDYIELGQGLNTLSGGESQRLKLASRLGRRGEFYILDEPTSGMHFADVEKLLSLIDRIVDEGNTVLATEHNLQVIRAADWIIDMGPEGGERGGRIIAEGTPEVIAQCKDSVTGRYL